MTDLNAALTTVGALVAQRAMMDMTALDGLVDSYRAHPDTYGLDESIVVGKLDSLVARLKTRNVAEPANAGAHVAARGAQIALAGTATTGDTLTLGAGVVGIAKIVDDCADTEAFSGRAGELVRAMVAHIPRPATP